MHSQEHASKGIGLHVNANETDFLGFKWESAISTLKWQVSKIRQVHVCWQQYLIDLKWCQHTPSKGVNCYWQVIDLMVWKSDLSDKIKWDFFQAVAVSILLYGCTTLMLKKKMLREKTWWKLFKNATRCFELILEAKPYKTEAVRPLTSHLKNHPSKVNKTCRTLLEKQGQTHKRYSSSDPYT